MRHESQSRPTFGVLGVGVRSITVDIHISQCMQYNRCLITMPFQNETLKSWSFASIATISTTPVNSYRPYQHPSALSVMSSSRESCHTITGANSCEQMPFLTAPFIFSVGFVLCKHFRLFSRPIANVHPRAADTPVARSIRLIFSLIGMAKLC